MTLFLLQFQELQVDREMQLTSNRSLAEESLARRPRLNNGKLQLAEKYKELSNLVTTCWEKQSQLGEFASPPRRHRFRDGAMRFWFHAAEMSVMARSLVCIHGQIDKRSPAALSSLKRFSGNSQRNQSEKVASQTLKVTANYTQ